MPPRYLDELHVKATKINEQIWNYHGLVNDMKKLVDEVVDDIMWTRYVITTHFFLVMYSVLSFGLDF